MYIEEVKCEEAHAVEDVWLCDPARVDDVRENQNASVEPGRCHAKCTEKSHSTIGSFAPASDILREYVSDVMQVHDGRTCQSHIHHKTEAIQKHSHYVMQHHLHVVVTYVIHHVMQQHVKMIAHCSKVVTL